MDARKFKVKTIEMEVGKLRLHAELNRELRVPRVRYLVQNMNLDALGRWAIWRDGRNFYVIDGQHRKVALEELGVADWIVSCDVYEGVTFADACELFLQFNNGLTVHPYDKFDKGVKAGRMAEVETNRIIKEAGFHVNRQAGDGAIACTQAAVDTWKLDQGDALTIALRISPEAWGHVMAAVDGHIVRGLGLVAARYNSELDYDALIKKLAKYSGGPSNLIGAAKGRRDFKGGTLSRNIAALVVDLYNKGRRSGKIAPL